MHITIDDVNFYDGPRMCIRKEKSPISGKMCFHDLVTPLILL